MFEVTAGEDAESWPRRRRPQHVAVALVDRVQHRVVTQLEQMFAVDHRRKLEQGVAAVHPDALEGRAHARRRGEETRVVLGVAIQRPREADGSVRGRFRQRRCRLSHERRMRVVDVAGAAAVVQVGAERGGADAARRVPPAPREPVASRGAGVCRRCSPARAAQAASLRDEATLGVPATAGSSSVELAPVRAGACGGCGGCGEPRHQTERPRVASDAGRRGRAGGQRSTTAATGSPPPAVAGSAQRRGRAPRDCCSATSSTVGSRRR